ncbi:MAG: 50S ribosomal protein L18e [Candidatus Marsarchaeota archaeon]|nr:50S ribosomal protein L18e [Candidatus Marsarchaeota archaeon]MCL5105907.1 50S ribosomal protein L18e [Candidatus Marsarchaeota archaeon]
MKIDMKQISKRIENPTTLEWFSVIAETRQNDRSNKIYENLAKLLNKRNSIKVNLWKLSKHSKDGDCLIVPGKVLGVGSLDHKISVCAIDFSESALEQLRKSSSTVIKIQEAIGKKGLKIII